MQNKLKPLGALLRDLDIDVGYHADTTIHDALEGIVIALQRLDWEQIKLMEPKCLHRIVPEQAAGTPAPDIKDVRDYAARSMCGYILNRLDVDGHGGCKLCLN